MNKYSISLFISEVVKYFLGQPNELSLQNNYNKYHSRDSHLCESNSGDSKFELSSLKQDIQALVCDELGVDRTYLYLNADKLLSDKNLTSLESKVSRLQSGEPLAYILGYKYFWNQKLKVTSDTLIPRADTEVLVESVLEMLKRLPRMALQSASSHSEEELDKFVKILDLGTGTGAIALALAEELPNAKVTAVDYSEKALTVAKINAVDNNIKNVEFIQSDWYTSLQNLKFDVIVSNPPYIDENDNDIDSNVKSYEPSNALFAKDNGLADIEKIISQARKHLTQGGNIFIEHGHTQAKAVSDIYTKYGFSNIETLKDLNEKDRCTKAIFF